MSYHEDRYHSEGQQSLPIFSQQFHKQWITWVWSLGWEDPLEKEMATHSGILAWKVPWMEKPGRLQSMGSQRVRHDWATSLTLGTFHPNAEGYTFFSSAYVTFFRIEHILGHKSNLSKFKKIEIISSIFSDYNAMRLAINCKKKKLQKSETRGD